MALAVASGLSSVAGLTIVLTVSQSAHAQQIQGEPFIYQQGDDSSGSPAFNTSATWSSGAAPVAGNNYVDDGWRIRTPPTTTSGANSVTFAGDSLTLISPNPSPYLGVPQYGIGGVNVGTSGSYGYLTFKGNGASNTTQINDLVLANAGVVINYGNDEQTLTGNIYLVPANVTLATDNSGDTITTSVSGGIIDTHGNNLSGTAGTNDNYMVVASNISGGGMLRIENTGGGTIGTSDFIQQVVVLSGSNTFSGGLILDGTSTAGVTGNGPDLAIDSPTALGTGTLSILDTTSFPNPGAPGTEIDNLTGATEVLTTNNPQVWYESFTFLGTNSLNMGSGAVNLQGNITLNVSQNTLVVGGPVTGSFGLTKGAAGTLVLNGVLSYTGPTTVSAGTLQLGATGSNLSGGVAITGGTLALTANHGVLITSALSIAGSTGAWTGKLDIGNNALDVQGGNIATLTNQVAQGYASGTWQGSAGITSSTAAANSSHLTAVGVIQNTIDGSTNGSPLYGSGTALGLFSGISPANTDVLIKYVYYGDTDLSGKVDGSDYSRIDAAYLNNQNASNTALTGWFNGDFNYDGVIDGSDYALIDNAFNSQGASLAATVAAQVAPGSAVPEPTTAGLLGVATLGLIGRRRLQCVRQSRRQ